MQIKKYETVFGGKKLSVEISDLADQANGSVLVRYEDTAVFATAVMGKNKREGLDYFPLSVDYEERFYAAGQILGSRFMRREGRPSEEAILSGRVIDRTIRPLFDKRIRNEVQVTMLILSIDTKNDSDIPAIIAASLALGVSDIPWGGPVGAVRIGHIPLAGGGQNFLVNPTYEERDNSILDAVICGTNGKINMIEAGAKEVPEDVAIKGLEKALEEIAVIQKFQEKIISEIGKEKAKVDLDEIPADMSDFFKKEIAKDLDKTIYGGDKGGIGELKHQWMKIAAEKFGDDKKNQADDLYEEEVNDIIHKEILENDKRPDGRKMDELRNIFAKAGFLPTLHGSGVFFRGGTHVLSVVTLGGPKDAQLIEGMEVQTEKHFMHHYNFPPFSTGETGRMGNPGRREIGHGALAERALSAIIPSREIFPYTIRIVSESMASNGSTSQGSICASVLALMDAGVPIKAPLAGIAMGLMMKDEKNFKVLTDIQGPEDHHGDMDFKVAGTKDGVTAIQMDVKVDGVTVEILEKTLKQAKKAREEIMGTMLKEIPEARKDLSAYAPRIIKIMIDPEKIGAVIGPAGKVIKSITEKTGADIDIEQDGTVLITGKNHKDTDAAKKMVEDLTHEFKAGEMATGPVTRMFEFGAMVDIGGGQEGLIHISELAPFRVEKVTDIVKPDQIVTVKVIGVDEKGRVNLSLKQADPNYNSELDPRGNGNGERNGGRTFDRPRPPRRDNNFRGRR
jgi:polyribonucleotide nucleotidyltransferase